MFVHLESDPEERIYRRSDQSRVTTLSPTAAFRFVKSVERFVLSTLLIASLLLSTFIVPTAPLSSSTSASVSSQAGGPWTNFSIADGLATDSILALDVGSNGHLWVGTTGGVNVLAPQGDWLTLKDADGLGDNFVTGITPDSTSTQRHWFATYGGSSLLDDGGSPMDKTDDTWITFRESDGLVKRYVSVVAVDSNGDVWFGTDQIDDEGNEIGYGVSMLDVNGTLFNKSDDTWTTYTSASSNLSHDVIRDIATDDQGVVWIATQSGLNAYSGGIWTVFYSSDGLASNGVTALLVVGDLLWVATQGGVSVLDYGSTPHNKADDRWATYTQYNSGLADNDTSFLAIDKAKRIWIGTDQKAGHDETGYGVSVLEANDTPFDRSDDIWTTFTMYNGLAHNAVRAVAAARSGTVWIDSIWIGTREGLNRLDYGSSPFYKGDDHWRTYTAAERLVGNSVYAVAGLGAQWLGTDQGLSLLHYNATPHVKQDDHWTTYTTADGLVADGIRALVVDGRRVWIGTAAGLTVLDTGGTPTYKGDDIKITYDSSNSVLIHDQINSIVIDSAGRAWIGDGSYSEGGLHVLDVGSYLSHRGDDTWATFTPLNSSLPNPYVESVALGARNVVWLGTHGGVARLNHAGSPFDKNDDTWTVFTTSNSGLAFNTVKDIAVDQAGNVWFALLMEGTSVCSSAGDWLTFTQSDGLAYNSVYAVAVDRAGNLWLGTDGGVSILDYRGTLSDKNDDVWTTYGGGTLLLSGHIRAVAVDAWGQVWLGTFGGGASVYSTVEIRQVYLPVVARNAQ